MSAELPHGRTVLTGNEAAAVAAVLARAQQIACYPITPQTLIVERLAELVAERDDIVFANLDSEHSMFGYALASERAGSRCFTATSSQGLLYSHEQLHRASRERIPLVAVNVNRSIVAPWSLEPDLADSMSQRDTGWVQLYCSSGQELLDSILCAYRIAERRCCRCSSARRASSSRTPQRSSTCRARRPWTRSCPPFRPPDDWVLDPHRPRAFSGLPEPRDYAVYQRNVAEAHERTRGLIAEVAADFAAAFGREKIASLELTGDPDADTAIVTIGTIGETARELLARRRDRCSSPASTRTVPSRAQSSPLRSRTSPTSASSTAPPPSAPPLRWARTCARSASAPRTPCRGLGGTDVTPETLRRALEEARGHAHDVGALYFVEGV